MKQRTRDTILVYVGWIAFLALSLWLIFLLQHNLVHDIFFMRVNPWQLRFVRQWSIFVFGAIWIFSVFLCEGYLRNGIDKGGLSHRFRNVGTPLLLLIALSWGLRLLP